MSEPYTDIERRSSPSHAIVDRSEGRHIKGDAIVFNRLSHVMRDRHIGRFRERIRPEAVDRTLRHAGIVKALWNHNDDLVLGSNKSGTLLLRKTATALAIDIDPPRWADPQLETIQRGDVDGMSFAFSVTEDGDEWDFETEDGIPERNVLDMEFSDVSIVAFQAYPDTTVEIAQRSLKQFQAMRRHSTSWRAQWDEIVRVGLG